MISIENLYFSYPVYGALDKNLRTLILKNSHKSTIKALNGINLKLNLGDRVGLIGHNGSGKSTLLKIISGIYYPTQGNIVVRKNVYSILDFSAGIIKDATGYENIFISAFYRGFKKKDIEKKINWIVDFSELGDSIHRPVRTYSSGMYIRLISSILLSQSPQIFVLDEFFGAGDKNFSNKVKNQILKMIQDSGIFIFASHDEILLKNICNRFIELDNGKVISDRKNY